MKQFAFAVTTALIALPAAGLAAEGQFDSAGVPLHVIDEGEGPAVIYLHSFAGGAEMWQHTGLLPLDGLRTIAFDARGHGRSGKPTEADAYGDEMVADVLRLMAARGIEQAHIVGYSMGAETALKLAADHPDKVLSLVVAGSGWSGAPEAEVYGFVSAALSGVASFGDFMAAMAPETEMPPQAEAAMLDMLAGHGIRPDQDAAPLAAVSGAMGALIDLPVAALARIDLPVLGLAGAEDPERDNVAALAEALPHFDFVEIQGADHLAAPLDPAFAAAVTSFLKN